MGFFRAVVISAIYPAAHDRLFSCRWLSYPILTRHHHYDNTAFIDQIDLHLISLGLLLWMPAGNEVQSKENGAPVDIPVCAKRLQWSDLRQLPQRLFGCIPSMVGSHPLFGCRYTPGAAYTITATATGQVQSTVSRVAPPSAAGSVGRNAANHQYNRYKTRKLQKYVTHTSASISGSGSRSWSFNWTAPAAAPVR